MKAIFPIIPATSGPMIIFGIVAVVLLSILLAIGVFAYASRYASFEVSPAGLAIRGDFIYGRRLPAASLRPGEAKAVDLTADRDLRLEMRTNGAGLPGYSSGWFRLGNGDKALVFVTDRRRVVYLPTREGYALLLSVPEPEKFLGALRQMLAAAAPGKG
jgi:hypothetical protein